MKKPMDELVADMVTVLDAGLREEFEERAAIMEFEGKLSLAHAECLALLNVLHRHPGALSGVILLQVGAARWLLTTDPDFVRRHQGAIGVRNLADVVREQYSGTAVLTPFDPEQC